MICSPRRPVGTHGLCVHVALWGNMVVRPLRQRLQRQDFNGDGRTDRASLQIVTREICEIEME